MRAGSNSFYAVRAVLPVPAVELTRDPAPTEEDMRAANERMQVAEDPSDDRPSSSLTYNNARDMESSSEVLPIQKAFYPRISHFDRRDTSHSSQFGR
jgi:hypothetical protein